MTSHNRQPRYIAPVCEARQTEQTTYFDYDILLSKSD